MAQLPTGTVTFLFTDIEGSTQLLQRLGDAYADALGEHQALLRAAFAAHEGAEVDTQGDAFFVAFPTAPQAVAAAAEATVALAAHSWPEGATLQVRMGLHTGAPQLVGDHYVGLDVHRAARIAAAGHGGQILLSDVTRQLAEQALPTGATLRAVGAHRLKDLREPEPLFQLVVADLPAEFPPLKTLDTHRHNLPLQPTPLLGREEQVATLTALLRRRDVRLVTLTGPGGIGKTHLATQVAAELIEDFADGVWFVRLSRLVDPALVLPTIAQALGLQEQGANPFAETLPAYLANKRLLLVLDNVEQVVAAAPEVAGLLGICAGVKALATSRIPLRLRSEREYPLAPLPLPERGSGKLAQELSQYAAVALFVERAQATRPNFTVTATNAPAIAEICARLDGLPLAIELAAARVKLLPPETLLTRLVHSLALLTGGARDLEERQQTMRAAIAWSEDLLTPSERTLFRRLAVFAGGATLEAVEAVCLTPEGVESLDLEALDGLSALVDQSLVLQREEGENGEPRFGLLHVIHEYGWERLEASGETRGEAEALRRAHAAYYLALAERAWSALRGPEQAVWLGRLEREHDNLRAALAWALGTPGPAAGPFASPLAGPGGTSGGKPGGKPAGKPGGGQEGSAPDLETGLRLVDALWVFWLVRGHLREGQSWAAALLAWAPAAGSEPGTAPGTAGTAPGNVPAGLWARGALAGGFLAFRQRNLAAEPWLEAAVAQARAAGDQETAATALNGLGSLAAQQGDLARAVARLEESLALYRALGDQLGAARTLSSLGDALVHQGDLARAAALFVEALALSRQVGESSSISLALLNLGWVARKRGELAEAAAYQREALALGRATGDARYCAECLENLAEAAGAAGQGERAARLLGAAAAAREPLGAPLPPNEEAEVEQAVATARLALGEAAWAAAFAAGRALTLEEAIAEALGEDGENG